MRIFLHFILLSFLTLAVEPIEPIWARNLKNPAPQSKQKLSDAAITAMVNTKFAENKLLSPLKIQVSTEKAVVALSGNVKNRETFVEALRVAKAIQGVKSVETDDLVIRKINTIFSDAYITAKVETAVLRAKVFDDESIPLVGINATTSDGTVTLSGDVRNNVSILAIIKRVNDIQGVKKIISRLQVNNANA